MKHILYNKRKIEMLVLFGCMTLGLGVILNDPSFELRELSIWFASLFGCVLFILLAIAIHVCLETEAGFGSFLSVFWLVLKSGFS